MDEKTGETRFDSPAFIEYLEKTDTLPYDTKVGDAVTAATDLPNFLSDNFFYQQVPLGVYTVQYFTANRRLVGQSTPLFYSDGEGDAPFSASRLWTIPKGGNTELAWEFMKFVVEEKEFSSSINPESVADYLKYFNPYAASIPINRNNFLYLYGAAFDKRLANDADAYKPTSQLDGHSGKLLQRPLDLRRGMRPADAGSGVDLSERVSATNICIYLGILEGDNEKI